MDNSVSDYERKYKVYYGRRRAGNPLAVSRKRTENKGTGGIIGGKRKPGNKTGGNDSQRIRRKNARIRQLEEELEAEHKKNELLRSIQERLQKIEQSVNGTPLKSPATEEKESGLFAWQKKK